MTDPDPIFDADCTRCARLSAHLAAVKRDHPDYYCRPVAPFGSRRARLLIVGLAPGKHGANATGRPFTGDYAGILLYETLHEFGFASRPQSTHRDDGLKLNNCRITNAVKCLPPENKPTTEEVRRCNTFLASEIAGLRPGSVILALGSVAHRAVLLALGLKLAAYPFAHANCHKLAGPLTLLDSYHCSRYNTQTRRLTPAMFRTVFDKARTLLETH